jgi:nucleotide-binding universal stress UspA family protein
VSEEARELVIRRILVGLDASGHSLAALEAAADLAARLEAELVGLFVEDINLLRLAELPFAREVGGFSATRRRLDSRQMERQLHVQAERARRALETHARRVQVHWSFQVTRGGVALELLTAASDADLVILGRASHFASSTGQLGSTARGVVAGATCPALVITQGKQLGLPVLVVFDGSPLAWKTLTVAAGLVRGEDRYLAIFVLAEGMQQAQGLKRRIAGWLRERKLVARYRLLARPSLSRLVEMIEREGCGTLVLQATSIYLEGAELLTLLDELELPVFLVH